MNTANKLTMLRVVMIPAFMLVLYLGFAGANYVALVIFARWRPLNAIWGSFLFGGLYILYLYIPGLSRNMQEIFKALPYVVTLVVLVITSLRKKREDQPPAGLGVAYFRESRS